MSQDFVPVEDSTFVRDIHSKAILNTDRVGLNNYYVQRDMFKKEQAEKLETQNRLTQIENDMSDIKMLLLKLLDKDMNNGS